MYYISRTNQALKYIKKNIHILTFTKFLRLFTLVVNKVIAIYGTFTDMLDSQILVSHAVASTSYYSITIQAFSFHETFFFGPV